jgi:hypothetical protein
MLDRALTDAEAAVRGAAEAYARALHACDTAALARLFHEGSHLYLSQDGVLTDWPRQRFLDRVGGREPAGSDADFEIESVDLAGPEMAWVRLSVGVPPRRFRDYLNFLKIDGEWRVIAKVFRVVDGPAV